jgi:hypothetical protein
MLSRTAIKKLKLEYITRPISATLEQSFPPGNSMEKVGFHDVVVVVAILMGLPQNPTFQAERCAALCDSAATAGCIQALGIIEEATGTS